MANNNIAIPTMPCRDIAAAKAFYTRLGFLCDDSHGDYMFVRWGESIEFHFFAAPDMDPLKDADSCYLRVDDVDGFYAKLAPFNLPNTGQPRLTAVENKPWGMRECALVDHSGTLLKIGTPLKA